LNLWPADALGFAAELIGDAGGEMAQAVALAGARMLECRPWGADAYPGPGLVILDAEGVDLATLEAALPGLVPLADIITCTLAEVDLVSNEALWSTAQILCEPSLAERIAALAIATELGEDADAGASVRDRSNGDHRRFAEEVARLAARLASLSAEQLGLADRRPAYDAGPAPLAVPVDPQLIRQAIRARRLRTTVFGPDLFEDPAWDMLLDLFAAELEDTHVSVSSLCIAAAVAPTTALRWIGRLTQVGLFERRPDPQDRRRAFMALTPRGSAAMRGYVAALGRAGLGLA
jgi:hypothetical protein